MRIRTVVFVSVILCALLLAVPCLGEGTVKQPLPGDVNNDGAVDGRDTVRLMKYLAEEIDPETGEVYAIDIDNTDVNGDKIVDELDLLRLVRYLGGEIENLVEKEPSPLKVHLVSYYLNGYWHLEVALGGYKEGIESFYLEALLSDLSLRYSTEKMKVRDHNILNNAEGYMRLSEGDYILQTQLSWLRIYAKDGAGNELDEIVRIHHGEVFDITVEGKDHPALEIIETVCERTGKSTYTVEVRIKANEKVPVPKVTISGGALRVSGQQDDTYTVQEGENGRDEILLNGIDMKTGIAKAFFKVTAEEGAYGTEEIQVSVTSQDGRATAPVNQEKLDFGLDESDPAEFTYTDHGDGTCEITGYLGSETFIITPKKSPEGLQVNGIADSAFIDRYTLKGAVISEGVEKLGDFAFSSCFNMANLSLPETLKEIGRSAFAGCYSLNSLFLPAAVEKCGENCFQDSGITELIIEGGKTVLEGAYSAASHVIKKVFLKVYSSEYYRIFSEAYNNETSTIYLWDEDKHVYQDVNDLYRFHTDLTFSAEVEAVRKDGKEAVVSFYMDQEIPADYIAGSEDMLVWPSKIRIHIDYPTDCMEYDLEGDEDNIPVDYTYTGKQKIVTITFRCKKDHAFAHTVSITGYATFEGQEITFESNKVYLGNLNADGSGRGLDYVILNDSYVSVTGFTNETLTSLEIPETIDGYPVREIAAGAFQGNTDITYLYLPENVETIGAGAFAGCAGLSSATFEGVKTIGDYAFENCESFSELIVKARVETVKTAVFKGCSNLTIRSQVDNPLLAIMAEGALENDMGGNAGTIANYVYIGRTEEDEQNVLFDEAFANDANSGGVNHALANLSIEAAQYAYSSPKDLLEYLGFEGVVAYDLSSGTDTVGHYVAVKMVRNKEGATVPLFAVIIRGTSGIKEWKSNFNLGYGEQHAGFTIATNRVKKNLKRYIDAFFNSSKGSSLNRQNYKLWITGHSRAAACGGILAAEFAVEQDHPSKDIYAYLYATPLYTKKDLNDTNIKNFVNAGDPVPRMAPGYNRRGITYINNHGNILDGREVLTGAQLDKLITLIKDSSPGIPALASDVQYVLEHLDSESPVGFTTSDWPKEGLVLIKALFSIDYIATAGKLAFGLDVSEIIDQFKVVGNCHYGENYQAWMQSAYPME